MTRDIEDYINDNWDTDKYGFTTKIKLINALLAREIPPTIEDAKLTMKAYQATLELPRYVGYDE